MRTPCEINATPLSNAEWWNKHVQYSKFRRQGIDIVCASFQHSKPAKANIIFLTGLTESFVKYSEVLQYYYERGFNIFTYDHQSQGLSGRWLAEPQSLWVNTFDDYIDDFVFFVHTITKDFPHSPVFVLAHSMGGFIVANAVSRIPTLVNRAVLCAPMLRMKCGTKSTDWKYPLPQPLAYWFSNVARYFGLGSMHAPGFFKEKPTDPININVYTSDREQQDKWIAMRMKYPNLITTCVTNDWTYHSIRAQRRFAERYQFVHTNTLILSAEHDYLVYNRAMRMLIQKSPCCKMFLVPGSYHEILMEREEIREAALKVIYDYFNQRSDDVTQVQPVYPLTLYDPHHSIVSWPELIVRGVGVTASIIGVVVGVAMLLGDRSAGSSKR